MKKLILLAAVLISGITTYAQTDNGNRMIVHQSDGQIKVFACNRVDSVNFVKVGDITAGVTVKEVSGSSATLTVKMPEGCTKCEFAFVEKSKETEISNIYAYVEENKAAEITESGDVTIKGLMAETDYIIYTLSRDIYNVAGNVVKTEVRSSNSAEDFVITIDELTSGHANLSIVPKDKDMTYVYTLLPKKKYEEAVDYNGDIFMYDVAWWEFLAENYGEDDWRTMMKQAQVKGDVAYDSQVEYGFMDWDTDHILYCYGINEKGDVTTQLYTKEFKTPKPTPSDNVITATITDIRNNGCDVNITTTNGDYYVVTAQKQEFIDYWEQEGGETEMLKTLYNDLEINTEYCFAKHSGDGNYTVKAQKPDTDYVLIIFGTNEGPSTKVQYIPFHTKAN